MEKKKITISSPMAIAGITLILVIKLSLNCQGAGSNIFFSGLKQPVNVVVASPSTKKAFNIDGDEIPIDPLLQEVPDLAGMLEKA
jgi:pyruvate/2-oxoglutarate dehydrogenase complex dihydrolipoamide acyltransferase (E2) component